MIASMNSSLKASRPRADEVLELSAHDRLRLAVEAAVCPATIRKFLLGATIRSTSRVRIERALRTLGFHRAHE